MKAGEYDPEEENSFTPSLANRIDRNTCGIVMAAKNAEALRILNQKSRREKYQNIISVSSTEDRKSKATRPKDFLKRTATGIW